LQLWLLFLHATDMTEGINTPQTTNRRMHTRARSECR